MKPTMDMKLKHSRVPWRPTLLRSLFLPCRMTAPVDASFHVERRRHARHNYGFS